MESKLLTIKSNFKGDIKRNDIILMNKKGNLYTEYDDHTENFFELFFCGIAQSDLDRSIFLKQKEAYIGVIVGGSVKMENDTFKKCSIGEYVGLFPIKNDTQQSKPSFIRLGSTIGKKAKILMECYQIFKAIVENTSIATEIDKNIEKFYNNKYKMYSEEAFKCIEMIDKIIAKPIGFIVRKHQSYSDCCIDFHKDICVPVSITSSYTLGNEHSYSVKTGDILVYKNKDGHSPDGYKRVMNFIDAGDDDFEFFGVSLIDQESKVYTYSSDVKGSAKICGLVDIPVHDIKEFKIGHQVFIKKSAPNKETNKCKFELNMEKEIWRMHMNKFIEHCENNRSLTKDLSVEYFKNYLQAKSEVKYIGIIKSMNMFKNIVTVLLNK